MNLTEHPPLVAANRRSPILHRSAFPFPRRTPFRCCARAFLAVATGFTALAAELPVVTVTQDNTRIDRSCEISIPADTVIPDADGNGVLQVTAD
ncbi:MAG: hypothetical protein KDM81_15900, partial [Verrucomicrobiae bacterium]|nr:hypothetical protein [Verrucomicrobiae bacterium]